MGWGPDDTEQGEGSWPGAQPSSSAAPLSWYDFLGEGALVIGFQVTTVACFATRLAGLDVGCGWGVCPSDLSH